MRDDTGVFPRPLHDAEKPKKSLSSLFRAEAGEALLAMMLSSGGDERIAQGADGRNPYGAPIRPTDGEIWFASSTASAISQRGWRAAEAALPDAFSALGAEDWFGALRQRLLAAFALDGAAAVLCASGTQAEYAALVCARGLDGDKPKKICNLLIAPDETGRGAPLAASGKHFLGSAPFGPSHPGKNLEGWSENGIFLETLPIRDTAGEPLTSDQIDAEGEFLARDYIAQGARVLLHVLDCSKTGLSGFSREMARKLLKEFPENICVVVDACQLRCAADVLRADLAAGFMVMVSGSKFAGGPAFSGALLLPPDMMRRLIGGGNFLAGRSGRPRRRARLAPALRDKIPGPFGARQIQGLGCAGKRRWRNMSFISRWTRR